MAAPAAPVAVPALVAGVLRGEHGHEGVRDVLRHPGQYGAVGLPPTDAAVGPDAPVLLRSKYKPGRSLRAYYRRSRLGPKSADELLAVTWSLPQTDADPGFECLTFPVDPAMPQLEDLTHVDRVVALTEELTGTRLPRLATTACVEPRRYRPGQRHVLVATLGSRSIYLKLDRDRSGAIAVPTAELMREALRDCPDVQVAAPIGYSESTSVALWWGEQGQTLSGLLAAGAALGPTAVRRASTALRVMHDRVPDAVSTDLPLVRRHEVTTEASAVLRAGEHIAVLLPDLWQLFEMLVAEAAGQLQGLPAGELGFAHGDFKSENVLLHHGQARVLDLDRACWAERAMDLGKILADLAWWCPPDAAYRAALRDAVPAGYGPCDPTVWVRAGLWSVLFRLKIAARRCPVHEPSWPTRVREQVECALDELNVVRGAG